MKIKIINRSLPLTFIFLLAACSLSMTHPNHGNFSYPSQFEAAQNPDNILKKTMLECQKKARADLLQSGQFFFRMQNRRIKDCLEEQGWRFHF